MKAANLLISNNGTLKIADFGLARPFKPEGEDYTSKVVTRWYRPPELFLGEKKYGPAVDMWGIGYVLQCDYHFVVQKSFRSDPAMLIYLHTLIYTF